MCRLRNIALESVTDGQTARQTDKVIPMCRYASQATQKRMQTMLSVAIFSQFRIIFFPFIFLISSKSRYGG